MGTPSLPGAKRNRLMSENSARCRPFIAFHPETGSRLEFRTMMEAEDKGFSTSSVRRALTGRKHYAGYIWQYKEAENVPEHLPEAR
jgi:hypothetical protein